VKITIKKISEQIVSAKDIKNLGLTAADIKKRIAPPSIGSDEWKAAEKKMNPETGSISPENERKILKAIRDTMLDPSIVNMIRQTLDRHLTSLSSPGSASPAAVEKTLAGNRPRSI